MAITAGASDCSTGLAKAIYDRLLADSARNGFIGTTPPEDWHDMVKAQCYAVAKEVADAHNADAYVSKETFGSPLEVDRSTTSGVLSDVVGLSFAIGANDVVGFEFILPYSTQSDAGGMLVAVSGPASPVGVYLSTASGYNSAVAVGTTPSASDIRLFRCYGLIRNGSNAGTVQLRFMGDGTGNSVTIRAGAFVRHAKVG